MSWGSIESSRRSSSGATAHDSEAGALAEALVLAGERAVLRSEPTSRADATAVDRFEIEAELGRGATAVVYLAHDPKLGRRVALKVAGAADRDPESAARFAREAANLAALDHEHVVRLYEAGEGPQVRALADGRRVEEGPPLRWLALQYVESTTLRKARLPLERALRAVAACARAIDHAHGEQIVHRDLKPENILISTEGKPFVTDFGFSRHAGVTSLSRTGQVIGTPPYMAPEQAAGHAHLIGPATDVYALGAILYEAVSGRTPFQGGAPDELLPRIIVEEPPPLRDAEGRPPPRDLDTIIGKCLEKGREDRYESAAALALDLERFLSGEPIRGRRPTFTSRVLRRAQRSPRLAASAAAAALVIIVMAVSLSLVLSRQAGRLRMRAAAHPHYQSGRDALEDADRALYVRDSAPAFIESRFDLAIARLDRAIALDPDFDDALFQRGRARSLAGRLLEGHEDLSRAVALAPTNPRYLLERGRLRRQLGGEAEARLFRGLALEGGAHATPSWWRERAAEDFVRARELARDDAEMRTYAEAEELSERDATHPLARERTQEALARNPASADLLILAARVGRDEDERERFFRRALDIRPLDAVALELLAMVLKQADQLPEALAISERAVARSPRSVAVRVLRAQILAFTGAFSEADVELIAAARIDPAEEVVRYLSGHAAFLAGDVQRGIRDITAAIALRPSDPSYHADRAMAHAEAGDLAAAAADLLEAVRLDPAYEQAYADAALLTRRFPDDPALAPLREQLRERFFFRRAHILFDLLAPLGERPHELVAQLEGAARAGGPEAILRAGLARIYRGDFQGADKCLARIATVRPADPRHVLALAVTRCLRTKGSARIVADPTVTNDVSAEVALVRAVALVSEGRRATIAKEARRTIEVLLLIAPGLRPILNDAP